MRLLNKKEKRMKKIILGLFLISSSYSAHFLCNIGADSIYYFGSEITGVSSPRKKNLLTIPENNIPDNGNEFEQKTSKIKFINDIKKMNAGVLSKYYAIGVSDDWYLSRNHFNLSSYNFEKKKFYIEGDYSLHIQGTSSHEIVFGDGRAICFDTKTVPLAIKKQVPYPIIKLPKSYPVAGINLAKKIATERDSLGGKWYLVAKISIEGIEHTVGPYNMFCYPKYLIWVSDDKKYLNRYITLPIK